MASLTAEQFAALDQRRSTQDLNDLLAILRRDGSVTVEGDLPEETYESDEDKAAAEEVRDEEIQNSQLLATPAGPPPVTDAEAEATKEAGEAETEYNEQFATAPPAEIPVKEGAATKAKTSKSSSSAEGS